MNPLHFSRATRTSPIRLLIAGDAIEYSHTISTALAGLTFPVQCTWAAETSHALTMLATSPQFDVVICAVGASAGGGEFLYQAAAHHPSAFVLLSAGGAGCAESAAILVQRRGSQLLGALALPLQAGQLVAVLTKFRRQRADDCADARHSAPSRVWTPDRLLRGIEQREFVPYFQPKVDLRTGQRNCVEILARWRHPELGILEPDEFIGPLEREGLIGKLTASLFMQSLDVAGQYARRGMQFGMAINVSPMTLEDSRVPLGLYSMVQQYGIPAGHITIEVTETASAQDFSAVMESLARLRMLGFEISVDDFGTGYSSLEMLKHVPFTELKIDRSFVAGLTCGDRKAGAIVTSIMQLARRLRLRTVAEGIETRPQLAQLRRLGCTTGQGYLFGKPVPPAGYVRDNIEECALAA